MRGRTGSMEPLSRTDPLISKTVLISPGLTWALFMGKVCVVMSPQTGWVQARWTERSGRLLFCQQNGSTYTSSGY